MGYAKLFRGFFSELDRALDIVPEDSIKLIGFNRRESEHTVSFVMHYRRPEDRTYFEELINHKLDDSFYETPTGNVSVLCVDLASIGTDFLRIYHDAPHNKSADSIREIHNVPSSTEVSPQNYEFIENVGYYMDKYHNIIGTKHYIRSFKDKCYYIDYFDANGNKIKDREIENEGTQLDWNGNPQILDVCIKNNIPYIFSKKNGKDQGYLIVNIDSM